MNEYEVLMATRGYSTLEVGFDLDTVAFRLCGIRSLGEIQDVLAWNDDAFDSCLQTKEAGEPPLPRERASDRGPTVGS